MCRRDPEPAAEVLNELYVRLRPARNATEAEPITEAIEQPWQCSGSDTVDLLMSRVDSFVLEPISISRCRSSTRSSISRRKTPKAGISAALVM